MSCYIVFIREQTHDPAEMKIYADSVPASLEGVDVKFLAAFGPQTVLEGPEPEGVSICEFPDVEAAKAWYHGPLYQKAVQHRFRGATYRAIIVEAFDGSI